MGDAAVITLRPEPLTAAAFAPFGSVIEADPGNVKAANLASRPAVGPNEAWAWPARW